MSSGPRVTIIAAGVILAAIFAVLGHGLSTSTDDVVGFVVLCLAAFLAYAAALWAARRLPPERSTLAVIVVGAVFFRATLIAVEGDPFFPDADAYRYVWDGRVVASGLSPYRFSPSQLDDFRDGLEPKDLSDAEREQLATLVTLSEEPPFDRLFPQIDHRTVPTIYPPLSQGLFAAASLLRPGSLVALKLLLACFDLGTLCLILVLLRKLGRNPLLVIVYAWNPLVIEEFAYAGHHDALAVFFLTLAAVLLVGRRSVLAGMALGLGIVSKVFPVVLLPILWRRAGWRSVGGVLLAAAAVTLPFVDAGGHLVAGLSEYSERWVFNPGLFVVLEALVGSNARWVAAGIVITVCLALVWRTSARSETALRDMLVVLAVLLLVSPVLDPWYVTWIVPLLCVFPFRPLILLTGCVFLHYLYFVDDRHPDWVLPVEYGIFYLALGLEALRAVRARKLIGV